jgi:PTS system mannose-specific IID component
MSRKFAAFGGCFTLMLLLMAAMPGAVFAAGPTNAGASAPDIHVTVWQAALIAIGYYLANSPWLFGLAYFTLYRPLVAGFLVGCILGHPAEGTLIGAAINVPFLGFLSAGGSLPIDPGFAGWVGVTLALAGHLDPATAVSIAMGLGLLGTLIFYGRMAVDSIFAHWADQRAEKADLTGVALMNWLPGQAFLLVVSFVPVFLFALNGPAYVQDILDRLPLWIVNGLVIAGGILPAIGIAMNMRFIFRGSVIPYFFLGFILMTVTHGSISLVVIAAIGLALAFLHLNFVRRDAPAVTGTAAAKAGTAGVAAPAVGGAAPAVGGAAPAVHLTRGDLLKSWALWSFFSHANYNYERLQGTGFAHAMTPIIKRLYSTEDEIRAALKRHLVFFNTEPNFGNVVHGTVIAMEEQRANGAAIDDDAINSVKSGLMGPMAGIGDTLSQSTIAPILLAIGIGIAGGTAAGSAIPTLSGATGNPLGAIIYSILISIVIVAIGYTAWMQGYARGRSFVTEILKSGTIDRVLVGAGVLGNMVLGALAATFVVVNLAPTVTIAGARMNLQAAIIDPIFPGALALGLVVMTWWLLRRRVNPLAILAAFLVVSILAAYPFFGPGQKNAGDYSYEACTSSLLHQYSPCGAPPPATPAPTPAATEAPAAGGSAQASAQP